MTGDMCLEAGVSLKERFENLCYLQIVAFAQDPIFSTEHGDENRLGLEHALSGPYGGQIDVLGTTPYVEKSYELGLTNVDWAIRTAIQHGKHLDFHLDYNVSKESKAMVRDVIKLLKKHNWVETAEGKTVVLGHCTRMTLFSDEEMQTLATEIHKARLPISFVGLPTSDLFMMGRPEHAWGGSRQRGTLQVLEMVKKFGLNACIGVNNVGNAFTPWGSGDPLALASLGVGMYQAGTEQDANLLFEMISTRARRAIGLAQSRDDQDVTGTIEKGRTGPLLVIANEDTINCVGLDEPVPARQRTSIRDLVWDTPTKRMVVIPSEGLGRDFLHH